MYVLIFIITIYSTNTMQPVSVTSQQVEFKTLESCILARDDITKYNGNKFLGCFKK